MIFTSDPQLFPDCDQHLSKIVVVIAALVGIVGFELQGEIGTGSSKTETTNQPGKEFRLIVQVVGPLGSGNVFGKVTMKTSSTNLPTLTIPVWVVATSAVTVMPAQIILPNNPLPKRTTQTVSVRSGWTNPLIVSGPSIDIKGVEMELKKLQPGRVFL